MTRKGFDMEKNRFTLIEMMIVVATVGIVALMLTPVIIFAWKTGYVQDFDKRYPGVLDEKMKNDIARSNANFDDDTWNEFRSVSRGEMKLEDANLLKRHFPKIKKNDGTMSSTSGDTYERWCSFTGNPKGWTRQEFEALAEKDQVIELRFANWATITGNPKGFTEEQFNALKAKGLVSFPSKDKKPEFNPGGF